MKPRIGVKLALGFGVVIGLATVIVVVALMRLATLDKGIYEITDKGLPRFELMHAIVNQADALTRDSRGILLAPDVLRRAREIAKLIGKLGITWSCNARANVNRETLQTMRDNGLRLLLVGYESGNQQILDNIKKGIRVEEAREFTRNCRKLGITYRRLATDTPLELALFDFLRARMQRGKFAKRRAAR